MTDEEIIDYILSILNGSKKEALQMRECVAKSAICLRLNASIEFMQKLNTWLARLKGFESGDVAWQGEMDSLSKVLIQRCKEVGIKDLYHLADYITIIENQKHQIEKMKCCANCKKERNKPEPLAVHISCMKCKDYSEWELSE